MGERGTNQTMWRIGMTAGVLVWLGLLVALGVVIWNLGRSIPEWGRTTYEELPPSSANLRFIRPFPFDADAGPSTSPNGNWTAEMHWVSRNTDSARVLVEIRDASTRTTYWDIFVLPLPNSAQYDPDGGLSVDWSEADTGEYAVVTVGGETQFLFLMASY
jgi:hypothetical protein